jgi:hypothetical protein
VVSAFFYIVTLIPRSFPANVMFHMQSLFKWSQFAVMYDKRDPYRAVASAISEKESIENEEGESKSWYTIINSFKVSNDMEEGELEEIFLQIKRYARSKISWDYTLHIRWLNYFQVY